LEDGDKVKGDLIFEHNTNPNKDKLKAGVPTSFPDSYNGNKCPGKWKLCPKGTVSDHYPFRVKVTIQ